ncbi:MAG: flavin reductase family protein [Burkholderiales bacterium]
MHKSQTALPTGHELSGVSPATLRQVAGTFITGVTVVTTLVDSQPYGCAANAVSSLSLNPPTMLVCLARTSNTHSHLIRSGRFAINILGDSAESREICRIFASKSEDKFSNIDYRHGRAGVPILKQAIGWMECQLSDAYDSGDHTIFIGKVVVAEATDGKPLAYFRGQFATIDR